MKNCIFCTHFQYSKATPDWSEYTPGNDLTIGCGNFDKCHWLVEPYVTNEAAFLEHMQSAETCPDFQRREQNETK
jgi:hypothetical protein